jgi:hypothetical protein
MFIDNAENQLNNLKNRITEWDEKYWFQRLFSRDKLTREDVEKEMLQIFSENFFVQLTEEDNIEINNKAVNLFLASKDLFAYEDFSQTLLKFAALKSIQSEARKLLEEMHQLAVTKLKAMKEVERLYGLLMKR